MSPTALSFDEYLEDPQLGGFSLTDLSTFQYQLTAYRAADAMPPRPGDLERCHAMTGRTQWPTAPSIEIQHNWCRRSGKSLLEMHRAVWHAIDNSHLDDLARGERASIRVTCPSKLQAQDSFGFLLGILEAPMLAPLVERSTQDTVSFRNRVDIRVTPASFRTSRGGSTKAWFFDEACFLYVDGLNALPELLAAAQPSLATIKGSRLYLLSSVYDQSTAMAEAKRRYWGVNDAPVLVTVGGFEILRPDLRAMVELAMARDPERARAEWYSQERSDLAAAFLEQWIDDAMTLEDRPIPRSVHVDWQYHGFFDASGGARDAAAFAIAMVEPGTEQRATVVFQRRWPAPHSPVAVISEVATFCREYGIVTVAGDRYAAGFTLDAFAAEGLAYVPTDKNRSELYCDLIPLLAVGKVELPRNERLRRELIALQRRTRSGGKDLVDHPVGGSDDLSNAAAGAVVHAWRARSQDFEAIVGPQSTASRANDGHFFGRAPWL